MAKKKSVKVMPSRLQVIVKFWKWPGVVKAWKWLTKHPLTPTTYTCTELHDHAVKMVALLRATCKERINPAEQKVFKTPTEYPSVSFATLDLTNLNQPEVVVHLRQIMEESYYSSTLANKLRVFESSCFLVFGNKYIQYQRTEFKRVLVSEYGLKRGVVDLILTKYPFLWLQPLMFLANPAIDLIMSRQPAKSSR